MNLPRLLLISGLTLSSACTIQPHRLQLAEERHACAEIGADPGSAQFSDCVANLDATLFQAENVAAR